MLGTKQPLQEAANVLVTRAESCFLLAEVQHESAAQQNESADDLDRLGQNLLVDAAMLNGKAEFDAARTSAPLHDDLAATDLGIDELTRLITGGRARADDGTRIPG